MSYDPRDEISSEIGGELVDILGGMKREGNCIEYPYSCYDKGCDEIYRFETEEDFNKVLKFINSGNCWFKRRIIVIDEKYWEIRVNLD